MSLVTHIHLLPAPTSLTHPYLLPPGRAVQARTEVEEVHQQVEGQTTQSYENEVRHGLARCWLEDRNGGYGRTGIWAVPGGVSVSVMDAGQKTNNCGSAIASPYMWRCWHSLAGG